MEVFGEKEDRDISGSEILSTFLTRYTKVTPNQWSAKECRRRFLPACVEPGLQRATDGGWNFFSGPRGNTT
jgi:hypothetical protein